MTMPFKWNSPEEIAGIIEEYFKTTPDEQITLTGLCIALDSNKQTLANYQVKSEFKHIIDMAKLRIENAYERSLRKNGRSGDIFALKNFGWKDQHDIDVPSGLKFTLNIGGEADSDNS
jgi:hypothetical protein